MSKNSRHVIQERWSEKQILGINGITFDSGEVIILDSYAFLGNNSSKKEKLFVKPLCKTSLDSILKYNPNPWVSTISRVAEITLDNGENVIYGEGEMGNEGFIARLDKNRFLRWSLFLDMSNPFEVAKLVSGSIIAENNNEDVFSISITHPEQIKVKLN